MDTLEETLLGHLPEVAADGVFGDAHGLAYFFCDDLTLFLEDREDLLFSMGGQHSWSSLFVHDIT